MLDDVSSRVLYWPFFFSLPHSGWNSPTPTEQNVTRPGSGCNIRGGMSSFLSLALRRRSSYRDECRAGGPDKVFCAMFAKLGTSEQSSNEVEVIKHTISQDRSNNYCDEFYGSCSPQPSNVTLNDARQLFQYLNVAYLEPARENIARGRLTHAKSSIIRIEYLLGPVDLPLGSESCCEGLDTLYIAPAFLADKSVWRDRRYVQQVMSLRRGNDESSRYPTIDTFARGIQAGNRGCYRTAAAEFSRLGLSDSGRRLRELGSYMAMVSTFRSHIYDPLECPEEQPPALTEAQLQLLKKQVLRRGFLTDIVQMEEAHLPRSSTDAS